VITTGHRGLSGLEELADEWRAATRVQPGRFFNEHAWWDAYLTALEPEPDRVVFLRLARAGELVAIVPLRQSTATRGRLTVRIVEIPRHDHLPLAGVYARADLSLDDLLDGIVAGLAQRGIRWDLLSMSHLLEEGIFAQRVKRLAWRSVREHVKRCEEVACTGQWDDYAAKLSSNFRSNLNKAFNKLAKLPDVKYATLRQLPEMLDAYPHFGRVEASGWKGEAGTAIVQDPRLDRFYRKLLDGFAPLGRARINTLAVADQIIAAQFCLVDVTSGRRTIYVFKLAYDETVAKLAPGNMLLRRVITSGDYDAVNLVGSPPWFGQWNPSATEVGRLTVFNTTARGALLLAADRAKTIARPIYHRLRALRRPAEAPHTGGGGP
jgi:CelD/BcsL family acetyltransferase involved in cellulose biosynthesis